LPAVNGDLGRRLKDIEKANADLGARLGEAESALAQSSSENRTLTETVKETRELELTSCAS